MDKTRMLHLLAVVALLAIPHEFALATLRTAFESGSWERKRYVAGSVVKEMIVMTNRLILIESGSLIYEAESASEHFSSGTMLFVPNWVRRTWTTPRGCRIAWCDFATEHLDESPGTIFWRRLSPGDRALEQEAFNRIGRLFGHANPETVTRTRMIFEGEVKAMLGRFWPFATAIHPGANITTNPAQRPDLIRARNRLIRQYARPDALEFVRKEISMSAAHFRRLFRRAYSESPHETILRLRMQRARFLLHETEMLIKEVAAAVGYSDPLYFSRQYTRFWGRSPRASRRGLTP